MFLQVLKTNDTPVVLLKEHLKFSINKRSRDSKMFLYMKIKIIHFCQTACVSLGQLNEGVMLVTRSDVKIYVFSFTELISFASL